ncbi:hypothetical protein A3F34_01425 [Candidatus Roizmanbacteria bacterium RIFCSPHIGHO2_12_FULL_44_10]|uniref:ATP-grasp fold RimK-type domain-containing protein n=1 Tax=Candidatus Roizmanbacteria bacterium RIFCSPHIGHO2_12_FULL_44_10 TaxID=1802054 RepID=A0A1F7I6A4_9BACT|nr:MAG: hypothetical protein A3F34_01425 [Candidatus Roizmanbacteria bacterium RIFCSPHIGHO2_12_FULL_44_10]
MNQQKKILILRATYGPSDEKNLAPLLRSRQFQLKYYKDLIIYLEPQPGTTKITIDGVPLESYDLVYIRTWKTRHFLSRIIGRYLQYKKIPFIDSETVSSSYGDKLVQYMGFHINRFPFPKTLFIPRESILKNQPLILNYFSLPFVMKSDFENKGKDNYLISSVGEINKILGKSTDDKNFIFQEFIPNNFDYRFCVFGYKTAIAYKRIRLQGSKTHLNNVSQGARVVKVPLAPIKKLCILAEKAARLSRIEVCGVDIVIDKNSQKPYIFEVNNIPGFSQRSAQNKLKKYLLSLAK